MANDLTFLGFISGRGSNLKSLITKCPTATFLGVISDSASAPGLAFARDAGIKCFPVERTDYTERSAFRAAVRKTAQELNPDFIVLAGYMQILEAEFIAHFENRILNIHPSLLPAFPGLDTHARALAAGVSEHGCSVHLVDTGIDTGPLIAQARVPVLAEDSEEALAARVLEREHCLYPWVVNGLLSGDLAFAGSAMQVTQSFRDSATANNFTLI